jgi:hypothetical protein
MVNLRMVNAAAENAKRAQKLRKNGIAPRKTRVSGAVNIIKLRALTIIPSLRLWTRKIQATQNQPTVSAVSLKNNNFVAVNASSRRYLRPFLLERKMPSMLFPVRFEAVECG